MSMQISGETTIFRNERNGVNGKWYSYSTPVAKKEEQTGKWRSVWFDVTFVEEAKGTILENKTRINITDSYLTNRTYTNRDGVEVTVPIIVVKAFAIPNKEQTAGGYSAMSYDDVPF